MHPILGKQVREKITGFTGTVMGRCEYLTGCNQLLVLPPQAPGDTKYPDSAWLDEQRCEELVAAAVVLDNGKTPGFERPAPRI